jgi:hypothetical protein
MNRDLAESLEHLPAVRLRPFSLMSRPPFLGPRRRALDGQAVARFRQWLAAALGLDSSASVEVAEWVSFDGRDAPHTTMVAISSNGRHLAFGIEKPLEKVEAQDVLERWRPRLEVGSSRRTVARAPARLAARE